MASAIKYGVLLISSCVLFSALPSSAEPPRVLGEYRRATQARANKNFEAQIVHLKTALSAAPSHPGLMADIARAYREMGDSRRAVEWLERAMALEGGLEVLDDPEFVRWLDAPEQASVRRNIDQLRQHAGSSRASFEVRERDLIPEGIAYDPVSRAFFLGSIYKRKIVRVDANGRATDFIGSKQDGLLSVLGMKVDAERGALWVAAAATESMMDATPADLGRSAVFKYDLRTGKLLKAFWADRGGGKRLLNDVVVDSRGNVFVTDSEEGSLYRIRPESDRLEPVIEPATWEYPNGVALSADERTAYVAHVSGIASVNLESGSWRDLGAPAGATIVGIDGLYRSGRTLIGVQNGIVPMRIVKMTLNEGGDRVRTVQTLERNHPSFNIPTTGVIVGDTLHYIANSQLSAFSPDHKIFPPERLQDVVILKVTIDSAVTSPGASRQGHRGP